MLRWLPLLSLLLFFCAETSAFADAQDELDLSQQFSPTVKIQDGGTCTLFAAASLVEAACFRRIRKHVDFSEAALYLQDLDRLMLDPNEPSAMLSRDGGSLSGMDGVGRGIWAINHLISGRDCYSASEVPFDTRLVEQIRNVIEEFGKEEDRKVIEVINLNPEKNAIALGQLKDEVRKEERLIADQALRARFGQTVTRSGSDPDIAACLNGPPLKVTDLSVSEIPGHRMPPNSPVSTDVVEQHLRRFNVPVLCEKTLTYVQSDGSRTTGLHAFLLTGAHSTAGGKKEFLVRDSNIENPYWMEISSCERAWAIE